MDQNQPNPFNASTRLSFQNDVNQYLELAIYNILGQKVKTLAMQVFSPGQYDFYWDGKDENNMDQSSGIYFGRLESREQTEMIKVIYMK